MTADLFRQHQELARGVARGMASKLPRNVDRDDLEQAALIGLHQWCTAHPDSAQPGWRGGLTLRVRGAIIDWLRAEDYLTRGARAEGLQQIVHLEDLHGDDGPGWQDKLGVIADPGEFTRLDANEALSAEMPARERHLVLEIFGRGRPRADVARELGMTEVRVWQLLDHAKRAMREHLERPHGASVQVLQAPKFRVRDFRRELWLARRNALWQRMRPGMSIRQLALALHMSETTVYYWCTSTSANFSKFGSFRKNDAISSAVRRRGKELIAAALRQEPAGRRASQLLTISESCLTAWRRRLLPEIPRCTSGKKPRVAYSEIAALYAQGLSIRQVAEAVGLTKTGVEHALRRLGVARRRNVPRRKDVTRERCLELRAQELSLQRIASRLRCSVNLVRARLREASP